MKRYSAPPLEYILKEIKKDKFWSNIFFLIWFINVIYYALFPSSLALALLIYFTTSLIVGYIYRSHWALLAKLTHGENDRHL